MKKTFEVVVEETLRRHVLIWAEDSYEAAERAEDLCNEGTIDLVCEDFNDRNVFVIGEKKKSEKPYLKVY